jgi:geranylgeranyl reductase family protein
VPPARETVGAEEVLRQRIQDSAEAQAWRLDHLVEYRSSRAWMVQAADLAADTGCRTPAEIAHQIAAALPEPMRTDTPQATRPAQSRVHRVNYSMSMSDSAEWDVAVIGAGPAGLAAANASALTGARTVVLERAEHPRYKTCGGGLIGTSLAAIPGTPIPVKDEIYAATFTRNSRHEFTRKHDCPILKMVMRDEFDDALRRRAVANGAVLLQRAPVRAVSQEPLFARATLANGASITAQVVVGADGSSGVTARHVGVDFCQVDLGLEVEIRVPVPVRQVWRGRVLLDWGQIPGSYGWVFPKDDRLTVGVIAARGSGEQTKTYLRDILYHHNLASFERVHDSGHLTRCRTEGSPLRRGRVLVAGDAAGLLEPWTREGISFALRSGALAGAAAAEAARQSGPENLDQVLSQYVSAVSSHLVPEMQAGRRLLTAFSRHPGSFHMALATPKGWHTFIEFCQGETSFASVLQHKSAALALYVLSNI